jgi:hypothetical protein
MVNMDIARSDAQEICVFYVKFPHFSFLFDYGQKQVFKFFFQSYILNIFDIYGVP